MTKEKVQFAARVPARLFKEFKDYCKKNGKIMEFETAELLRGYLERKKKEGK